MHFSKATSELEQLYVVPTFRRLLAFPDARLIREAAILLSRPRRQPASSFVLHAPLELAARAALLPRVAPAQRELARLRIAALVADYQSSDEPVREPRAMAFDSPEHAARTLRSAIDAGELDDADASAAFLGRTALPAQLVSLLAEDVVPRLSAAAHASIFLYQLPRVSPRGELTGELLRPLVRELARESAWRLRWQHELSVSSSRSERSLFEAIAATPRLGVPGSEFIYPLMSQVEERGVAAELLMEPVASAELGSAAQSLLRSAALSMLHEPAAYARYGWSHCLTLPQAVLGIASACTSPRRALAVAATYVVGFRAAFAERPLPDAYKPEPPSMTFERALQISPALASAALWHTPAERYGDAVTRMVSYAATHHDAHLVKYVLACLDAADSDRSHARLYLAAAAALVGTWRAADLAYAPSSAGMRATPATRQGA